ncbi:MAG: ribbon-helix-helix domain-containing protein [Aestuariivirga sp.]
MCYSNAIMSIFVLQKKRGRPATGHDPVMTIRLPKDLKAAIDKWAARQSDAPNRSDAIRCILADFLKRRGLM